MIEHSPEIIGIVIIAALLLVFAMIVAFLIHVASSDGRDFGYENV